MLFFLRGIGVAGKPVFVVLTNRCFAMFEAACLRIFSYIFPQVKLHDA